MIPFSPPYIDEDVINEVEESLRSGWITTGPRVKALEKLLSEHAGVNKTICVNSWTSGAMLVLKWWGIKDGDEVIIPAYTYSATALAVIHCGGKPVMVDVGNDFNINSENIRKAVTPKTKAVIPVDIAGFPCDYDLIYDVINSAGIKKLFNPETENQRKLGRILVISDSAHSLGAVYRKKPSGCLSDISVFSLHAVKNVTTAEGGAVCLNLPDSFDENETYEFLKLNSMNGQTKDAFTKTQAGSWRYDIIYAGMKINMPDVLAAIGLAQLRKYKSLLNLRKEIFDVYNDYFGKHKWAIIPPSEDEKRNSSLHIYPLRIKGFGEDKRDELIKYLEKKGISANVHFIPLPMLTLFKDLGYKIEDFPNAFSLYENEVTLPVYPQLKKEEAAFIAESVIDFCS